VNETGRDAPEAVLDFAFHEKLRKMLWAIWTLGASFFRTEDGNGKTISADFLISIGVAHKN
jgi:hypothetical protein